MWYALGGSLAQFSVPLRNLEHCRHLHAWILTSYFHIPATVFIHALCNYMTCLWTDPDRPLCGMLAVDTLTLSNTCVLCAAVQCGRAWLPMDLFSSAWRSLHAVAEICFCHLHCSSLCTSVFERYNQHDVSVQNARVPTCIPPNLTVTFTGMCHVLSYMSTRIYCYQIFGLQNIVAMTSGVTLIWVYHNI